MSHYDEGDANGEILSFRRAGYMARTPESPTTDTNTGGALEIAGPVYKTLW
jgi:hypothetical protein